MPIAVQALMNFVRLFLLIFPVLFPTIKSHAETIQTFKLPIEFSVESALYHPLVVPIYGVRETDAAKNRELWSKERLTRLNRILSDLITRFPSLMSRVKREGYSFQMVEVQSRRELKVHGYLDSINKRITIGVGVFSPIFGDRRFKFDYVAKTVLHEILHVIDEPLNQYPLSHRMLAQLGFSSQQGLFKNVIIPEVGLTAMNAKFNDLVDAEEIVEGILLGQSMTRPFGYPSIYSVIGGPAECFADTGAYIAFDPDASKYMNPALVRWFYDHVLN
jgi:hypothetical protein